MMTTGPNDDAVRKPHARRHAVRLADFMSDIYRQRVSSTKPAGRVRTDDGRQGADGRRQLIGLDYAEYS